MFKRIIVILIALNLIAGFFAIYLINGKRAQERSPYNLLLSGRKQTYDPVSVERKLIAFGAFTGADATIFVGIQNRHLHYQGIQKAGIDKLISFLASPAPAGGNTSGEDVRRILCLSILADVFYGQRLDDSEHRLLSVELAKTFQRSGTATPAEVALAEICADRGNFQECLPLMLPLQDSPNDKVRRLATRFIRRHTNKNG